MFLLWLTVSDFTFGIFKTFLETRTMNIKNRSESNPVLYFVRDLMKYWNGKMYYNINIISLGRCKNTILFGPASHYV
jgi:hypothetical protein